MNPKDAYNIWADQYDTNHNKTRDLEAESLRETLANIEFENCLEIGCGTGKNTAWLLTKATKITAIDLSEKMLAKAQAKINSNKVHFHQGDITQDWTFVQEPYDLITFSLVLEHIENLDDIFQKISKFIKSDGYVYIGELHPFKQYSGTKARFETENGLQTVNCFNHHLSDFAQGAANNGLQIVEIKEYFDDKDRSNLPRILTLLLKKQSSFTNPNP